MQHVKCPVCGHERVTVTPSLAGATPAANGVAGPPLPPEVANWSIERPSPDLLAWARQTFDEAAYLDAVRELQETGGGDIYALIEELRQEVHDNA